MKIKKIFANNERWIADKLKLDSQYFTKLASGQRPEILYIGCSDSRVTAEDMMGAEPGELFVHRNIANLVPINDICSMSVINFAVEHLKVSHIVVCGHYGCGGVAAAMQSNNLGILNPWLGNIRDVYRLHKAELETILDESQRYDRLVELNVQEQCINVFKLPDVQSANRENRVSIHGWVFNISTGRISDLAIDFNSVIAEIKDIYEVADSKEK